LTQNVAVIGLDRVDVRPNQVAIDGLQIGTPMN
jgi:hypothetical protein